MKLLLLPLLLLVSSCDGQIKIETKQVEAAPVVSDGSWKWLNKDFNFFTDALKFLNSLPDSQRLDAYIIALNSERSGLINGYYTVIYKSN